MPALVSCPSCGLQYTVFEQHAGTVIQCLSCHTHILVPVTLENTTAQDGGATIAKKPPPIQTQHQGGAVTQPPPPIQTQHQGGADARNPPPIKAQAEGSAVAEEFPQIKTQSPRRRQRSLMARLLVLLVWVVPHFAITGSAYYLYKTGKVNEWLSFRTVTERDGSSQAAEGSPQHLDNRQEKPNSNFQRNNTLPPNNKSVLTRPSDPRQESVLASKSEAFPILRAAVNRPLTRQTIRIPDGVSVLGYTDTLQTSAFRSPILAALTDNGRDQEIYVYGIRSGAPMHQFRTPQISRLLAVNNNGLQVLVAKRSVNNEQLKLLRTDRPDDVGKSIPGKETRWARFIGSDRLLICDKQGNLNMWSLPNVRSVYKVSARLKKDMPTFTPRGDVLYDFSNDKIRFFDVQSGQLAATVHLNDSIKEKAIKGVRFSPDGKQMALLLLDPQNPRKRTVQYWDLDKRMPICEVIVSRFSGPLRWLGNKYLLIGSELFSAKHQRIVWRFDQVLCNAVTTDGSLFYFKDSDRQPTFHVYKLVDSKIEKRISQQANLPEIEVKSGSSIAVSIDGNTEGLTSEQLAQLTKACRLKLKQAGYTFSKSSPQRLQVTVHQNVFTEKFKVVRKSIHPNTGKMVETPFRLPNQEIRILARLFDKHNRRKAIAHATDSLNRWSIPRVVTGPGNGSDLVLSKCWDEACNRLKDRLQLNVEYVPDLVGKSSGIANLSFDQGDQRRQMARMPRVRKFPRPNNQNPFHHLIEKELPNKNTVAPWTVKMRIIPTGRKVKDARAELLGNIRIKDIKFASADRDQVAILYEARVRYKRKSFLGRYDLRRHRWISRTVIDDDAVLSDFRLDGKYMLLSNRKTPGWVLVHDCTQAGSPIAASVNLPVENSLNTYRVLAGPHHLLVSDGRHVSLWDFETSEQKYRQKMHSRKLCLSHGRNYYLDLEDRRVCVRNSMDGKVAGYLDRQSPKSKLGFQDPRMLSIRYAAFHRNGKLVAAELSDSMGSSGTIHVWSLKNGRLMHSFQTTDVINGLQWYGNHYLMVVGSNGSERLYDLQQETSVWRYQVHSPIKRLLSNVPGVCGWFTVSNTVTSRTRSGNRNQNQTRLCRTPIPSLAVKKAIRKKFRPEMAWIQKGDSVGVQVKLKKSIHDFAKVQNQITDIFAKKLRHNGFEIDKRSPVQLTVSIDELNPNHSNAAFRFNHEKNSFSMPDRFLVAEVFLNANLGESTWRKTVTVYLPEIDYEVNWTLREPAIDLKLQLENALLDRLKQLEIPATVLKNSHTVFGTSTFDLNGEHVIPVGRIQ